MTTNPFTGLGRILAGAIMAASVSAAAAAAEDQQSRGAYLATIMDCGGCHTGGALKGEPDEARYLAGSEIGFFIPGIGVVYPKNLTPDKVTGLGDWSDAEIIQAIRYGLSRDGRALAPIMPWRSYNALSDADAQALVAYLRSIPAVSFTVPKNAQEGEEAPSPYLGLVIPK